MFNLFIHNIMQATETQKSVEPLKWMTDRVEFKERMNIILTFKIFMHLTWWKKN
jgi:hypothetical protein